MNGGMAPKLRMLRAERRWSQADLAARMNTNPLHQQWTRQTVGEVEWDRRKVTVDELANLALVLGVPIGYLGGWE
jgi:transcriptional regulator with XRE-family HTH domain